ncbi:hypothetical protein K0H71_16360 [Bacillus sp. IITD106]|nr:hypothetical protein [Bacillus sp. IITD106]
MKKVIVMFLVLIALAGCSLRSFSKENQTPSTGKIVVDKAEYEMMGGQYKWNGENVEIQRVDHVSPIEIAKEFDTLILEKNKKIDILIEKNPSLTVYQWTEDGSVKEVTLTDNQITAPSNNGYYIYEVVGKWLDGEASYIFDIEVE